MFMQFNFEINVVDFDNSANLTRIYEIKKKVWVTEVLKDKKYAIRKKKTNGRCIL